MSIGYHSARNYYPRRLSAKPEEKLTSLQLFTGDDATLSKAYEMRDTLKRLDAHKCGTAKGDLNSDNNSLAYYRMYIQITVILSYTTIPHPHN